MNTRALRNNNPGNLRPGDHWQGLLPRGQMNPQQAAESDFAVFAAPRWGFRAMSITLLNYVRLHHLTTLREIISRWAPEADGNDTEAYIADVSADVGLAPDTAADFTKPDLLAALERSMSKHECGGWHFADADIKAGIAMAEGA